MKYSSASIVSKLDDISAEMWRLKFFSERYQEHQNNEMKHKKKHNIK